MPGSTFLRPTACPARDMPRSIFLLSGGASVYRDTDNSATEREAGKPPARLESSIKIRLPILTAGNT
jgi:hypothetical protein